MIPPFRQFNAQFNGDRLLSMLQDNIQRVTDAIIGKDILDGVLLSAKFTAANTDLQLTHGLNRPVNWLAGSLSASASIYDSSTSGSNPKNVIVLQASAPCSCMIWVF